LINAKEKQANLRSLSLSTHNDTSGEGTKQVIKGKTLPKF